MHFQDGGPVRPVQVRQRQAGRVQLGARQYGAHGQGQKGHGYEATDHHQHAGGHPEAGLLVGVRPHGLRAGAGGTSAVRAVSPCCQASGAIDVASNPWMRGDAAAVARMRRGTPARSVAVGPEVREPSPGPHQHAEKYIISLEAIRSSLGRRSQGWGPTPRAHARGWLARRSLWNTQASYEPCVPKFMYFYAGFGVWGWRTGGSSPASGSTTWPKTRKPELETTSRPTPNVWSPNSLSCVRATGFLHQPNGRHHLARGCQSWPSSGVRRRPAGPPPTCLGGGLYKSWPARSASSSFRAAVTVRGLGSRPANSAGKSRQATLSCTRRANM